MTPWKYADAAQTVVFCVLDDGSTESCLATRSDVQAWVAAGNIIAPPDVAPPSMVLSKLAFLERMSLAERIASRAKAQVDSVVADLMDLLMHADEVHLDHPTTVQGVQYLESVGVLALGRGAVILDPGKTSP